VLIVVICMERSLHESIYLFLCSLFVNDLYGSTGLFPALTTHLVSDDHTVSTVCCYLQIFVLYTYGSIEFSNLAAMSYDRYLLYMLSTAVLQHHDNQQGVYFNVCNMVYSFAKSIITLTLTIHLQLCRNVIDKVYCVMML
jgi:hypothetical protein